MPRVPRRRVFDPQVTGTYHCTQRCVRRAFLCGKDPLSGRNCEHRKGWIYERLRELASIFAFDFLNHAVLSNHLHVLVRNRPRVARRWSDAEVVRRWWKLHPKRRNPDGSPKRITARELQTLKADKKQVAIWRDRLGQLSWLMKSLAEPIARRANAEEEITGRFWQGRYRSVKIEDEAALLACAVYIDLNPIRAGLAPSPELARYSSAYDRIRAMQQRSGKSKQRGSGQDRVADDWLAPVQVDERMTVDKACEPSAGGWRCSDKGYLSMPLEKYLDLLDWTGRQVRTGKREGRIPPELAPLLERLGIVEPLWLELVASFGQWFGRAAGGARALAELAANQQQRWIRGIGTARKVFTV